MILEKIKEIAETLENSNGKPYTCYIDKKTGVLENISGKKIDTPQAPMCLIYTKIYGKINETNGVYSKRVELLIALMDKANSKSEDFVMKKQIEKAKELLDKLREQMNVLTREVNYTEGRNQFNDSLTGVIFELEIESSGETICN